MLDRVFVPVFPIENAAVARFSTLEGRWGDPDCAPTKWKTKTGLQADLALESASCVKDDADETRNAGIDSSFCSSEYHRV